MSDYRKRLEAGLRAVSSYSMAYKMSDAADEIDREIGYSAACEALEAAQEELRLLRMKDTATVYDPTLRARIYTALRVARGEENLNGG